MKIGIIGGGQLAFMMITNNQAHEYYVLDPNKNCSCKDIATILPYEFNNKSAYVKLANLVDVVTFEFENIEYDCLKQIEDKLLPKSNVLKYSKYRQIEKQFAKDHNINVVPFEIVKTKDQLESFIEQYKLPVIIKTTSMGYDGKGQFKINTMQDLHNNTALFFDQKFEFIVEKFIKFDYESSCIISKDQFSNVSYIPSMVNVHEKQILRVTKPLNDEKVKAKMQVMTKQLAEALALTGTLCAEFYITGETIYFNEMAPRVHNSGHHSTLSSSVSQFENHIKVVSGQKVSRVDVVVPTIMINLLGDELEKVKRYLTTQGLDVKYQLIDYLKPEIKALRKRGHINLASDNKDKLIWNANKILKVIGVENEEILCY